MRTNSELSAVVLEVDNRALFTLDVDIRLATWALGVDELY